MVEDSAAILAVSCVEAVSTAETLDSLAGLKADLSHLVSGL